MPSGPDYVVHKTRAGLALVGVAGVISAMTTAALLGYIVIRARRGGSQSALAKGVRSFLHSPMGWYFISLTVCDCLQAFAFGANFYWVPSNNIYTGRFCDMQGFISQIGDLGAVVWSVAISYQTFFLLFLQRKPAPWVPLMTLVIGWALIFILPIIGSTALRNATGSFWGDSGAWCWISAEHSLPRIFFLHFFIYIALLSSLIVYGLIYLKFAGFIEYPRENPVTTTTTRWPLPMSHSRPASYADTVQESDIVTSDLAKIARRLMLYPIVFTFICVPIAVCRIRILLRLDVPFWLYVFAGVLYTSSGTANAALFFATRHAFIQVGAGMGVQITTHQICVFDPQVDGFAREPRRRRAYDSKVLFPTACAPSPGRDGQVAFKVNPGSPGVDSLHTPGDSVVTVLDDRGEHDEDPDKTGVHVYPPVVKWAD